MPPRSSCQRLKGLRPSMPLVVNCEWGECAQEFDSMAPFSSHITDHLQQVLREAPGGHNEEEEEEDDEYNGDYYVCEWRECLQDVGSDFIDLVRHVYFHAFHAKLKSYGATVISSNDLDMCMLDATSRNMIPELPDRLQCGWKDCQEVCDNPDYFYEHVSSHINVYANGNYIEGGALCRWEGCDVTVKSRYRLREHLRSHTQEKVVACPTCGGLFANTTKLFDHLRRQLQSDVQTYQCSHCNKRCPTERLLRDHMRHHVNHYKCPFCDMTCPNPSGLRSHIKYRHSDDKPYSCTHCDYRCKGATDLRRHLVYCHGAGAFTCHVDGCEYMAGSYFSLSAHFKQQHQGVPVARYQCHLCLQSFTRGTNLTRHLKKGHKFKWPSGHKRFRYKIHEDGIYRLQTIRYESIELTQQLLTDKIQHQGGATSIDNTPSDDSTPDPGALNQSCPAGAPSGDSENQIAGSSADLSYNLEMLGDVALKLPQGRFSHRFGGTEGVEEEVSDGDSDVSDFDQFSDGVAMSHVELGPSQDFSTRSRGHHGPQSWKHTPSKQRKRPADDTNDSPHSHRRERRKRIIIEPAASLGYQGDASDDYYDMPLDLTAASTDIPPMVGPGVQSVNVEVVNGRLVDSTMAPPAGRSMHQLQSMPANIEDTSLLLAPE